MQAGYLIIIIIPCFTQDMKAQSSSGPPHAAREQTTNERQSQLKALGKAGGPARGKKSLFWRTNTEAAKLSSRIRQGLEFAVVVESARKTTGSSPGERAAHKLSPLRDTELKPSLRRGCGRSPGCIQDTSWRDQPPSPVSFPCSGFIRGLSHCSGCSDLPRALNPPASGQ